MQWIKAPFDPEDEMRASISFVEQSRLSHLLGCRCFFPGISRELSDNLESLIRITDGLIDAWSQESCAAAGTCVSNIDGLVKKMSAATGDRSLGAASEVLAMAKSIFQLMGMDGADRLVEFCCNDKTFISSWGTPAHYAIFQRTA
jgi:hypothetical protein